MNFSAFLLPGHDGFNWTIQAADIYINIYKKEGEKVKEHSEQSHPSYNTVLTL